MKGDNTLVLEGSGRFYSGTSPETKLHIRKEDKMSLEKEIRVTVYDPKGKVREVLEMKEVTFKKSGDMSRAFSTIFHNALDTVAEGGAFFVERIWKV